MRPVDVCVDVSVGGGHEGGSDRKNPRAENSRRPSLGFAARFVLAAVALCPPAAQAQWDKPIDWLFQCTALIEAAAGADHPLCDDLHYEGSIKTNLDAASRWLESLGFASPAISVHLDLAHHMEGEPDQSQGLQMASHSDSRCEDRFCAWLVYGLGKYGAYSWTDSSLALDPFRRTDQGLEPGYDEGFGFAEVHELFHGVQNGYPQAWQTLQSDWVRWLLEGTAEHVARAAGSTIGLSVAGAVWHRTYDQPLHSPPNEDPDTRDFQSWAYGSWEFFDFLGEYLGSAGGVQYIDHLLGTLAPGQKNGLLAVEAAIQAEAGKSLYDAFPEFVTRRLVYPCYFSHLGTWTDDDCAEGPDNEHRFELSFPDTVQRLDHLTSDVSANGYLVRMEVPEGKMGHLIIRVPPDQDEEYLHLIVDDQRRDEPGPAGRRNEYTTVLSAGSHEFLVRLANVPRDLAEVDAEGFNFDGAPIEFVLIEYDAVIAYSGDTYSGDFEVTDWWLGAGLRSSPEYPDACFVQLSVRSEDVVGDFDLSVMFLGNLPAPLAPGRYSVVPPGGESLGLGVLGADVSIPPQFRGLVPGEDGAFSRMVQFQGEVELTDVNRSGAAGRFDIVGSGPNSAGNRLAGTFHVTFGRPGAPKRLSKDPCAPVDSGSTGAGRDGGGGGGDQGGDEGGGDEGGGGADGEGGGGADGEGGRGAGGEPDEPRGTEPSRERPAEPRAEPPARPGAEPPARPEPAADPVARGGELRGPQLILDFVENRGSVLRSEPQLVQGTGSLARVTASSTSYDVTLARESWGAGCTVRPSESAAEQGQQILAYQQWLDSGRKTRDQVLFDFTAMELRLDASSGEVVLDLEGAEGGVTLRGTAEDAVSLREGGRTTILGDVSDLTLEVTVDQYTFSCVEPMGFSFSISQAR